MATFLLIIFLCNPEHPCAITIDHLDYPDMKTCKDIKRQFDSTQAGLAFVNDIYSWSTCLEMKD